GYILMSSSLSHSNLIDMINLKNIINSNRSDKIIILPNLKFQYQNQNCLHIIKRIPNIQSNDVIDISDNKYIKQIYQDKVISEKGIELALKDSAPIIKTLTKNTTDSIPMMLSKGVLLDDCIEKKKVNIYDQRIKEINKELKDKEMELYELLGLINIKK
ncbi:MAG: hypothetical protein WBO70_00215, partial [Erysipelotrichaceae bacterium]